MRFQSRRTRENLGEHVKLAMKRLRTDADLEELTRRIRTLRPDSPRQFGKMSCPQMVCHLADAFRSPLKERPPSAPHDNWITRTVIKWVALRTSVPWVHGAPTSPEIDQVAGAGTPPGQFAADVEVLIELMKRFVAQPDSNQRPPHPGFGRLTESDWQRWGWAHVDHHLRQFGA